MVRIEEVQDETEKLRQQGLATEKDDDDEWEAIDADTDDVCVLSCLLMTNTSRMMISQMTKMWMNVA